MRFARPRRGLLGLLAALVLCAVITVVAILLLAVAVVFGIGFYLFGHVAGHAIHYLHWRLG